MLKKLPVLLLMMLINIAVFVTMWYVAPDHKPGLGDLVGWGANLAPMTLTGDWWRLFTSAFLHASWMHLLLNMYALFVIGMLVELAFGSMQFGVIYLLSALAGSLLSAEWHGHPDMGAGGIDADVASQMLIVSVGASGAIMGLAGAALAIWIYQRMKAVDAPMPTASAEVIDQDGVVTAPADVTVAPAAAGAPVSAMQARLLSMTVSGKALIQVIVLTFGQSIVTSHIDQTAHFGGLVMGLAVGLIFCLLASSGGVGRRIALPIGLLCVGAAGMFGIARAGSNETLLAVRAGYDEALQGLQAQRNAAKKVAQIEAQAKADAAHRPPPVGEAEAAGQIVLLPAAHAMAVGSSGRTVYVANSNANTLLLVDAASHAITKTIQGVVLPEKDRRTAAALSVAVSRDEHYAYVASMRPDGVQRINLSTGTLDGDLATGRVPLEVRLSSDGTRLYVLNGEDNTVSIIDVEKWTVLPTKLTVGAPLPGQGARSVAMWLSQDGAHLFVERGDARGYREFDTRTFEKVKDSNFGYGVAVPASGDNVWIDDSQMKDAVRWSNSDTGKTLVQYPVCYQGPSSYDGVAAGSIDGKWLVSKRERELQLINTTTRETVGRYPTRTPSSVIFSPDMKTLFVLGYAPSGQDQLAIIDVSKSLPLEEKDYNRFLCKYGLKDADPSLDADSGAGDS